MRGKGLRLGGYRNSVKGVNDAWIQVYVDVMRYVEVELRVKLLDSLSTTTADPTVSGSAGGNANEETDGGDEHEEG